MFVNYEKITQILAYFLPTNLRQNLINWGYEKKISQNLNYINKNKIKVLKNLRKKIKTKKLIVAFYVYDETKWKCQYLYELMDKSKFFIPYILVSRNSAKENSTSFQPLNNIEKAYNFFNAKNMRILSGYDIKKQKFIPIKKLKPCPDIIIYQHPWFVETSQNAVVASNFALTCYIPYFIATSISKTEYYLRFHQYIEKFYVLDEKVKKHYSKNMQNNGTNLKVVGHPQLDYFYKNKNKQFEDKNYIIYAPHWSIDEQTDLKWGTFLWSSEIVLNFAQKYPEYNWVFKPHPNLKQILALRHWSSEKIESYWKKWEKIGIVHESGDYLDLFMQSNLMITDSGSFQTEYFMTQKPCIYLNSLKGTPFNESVQNIVDNYYHAEDKNELESLLEKLLVEKNDYKEKNRLELLNKMNLKNTYASENIINDILNTLEMRE